MPPKEKAEAGKKPAKPKTPTLINGLTKDEMSKEQLEEHIARLREELNREREERRYFQLERDEVHSFWEITIRKQEEVEAELKRVDKDMEEDEARHQLDVKVYKQKIKHLQHEHLNAISELNADSLAASEMLEEEQEQLEAELRKAVTRVDVQEVNIEQFDLELELKHNEEMAARRIGLEKTLAEATASCENRLQALQRDLENVTKSLMSDHESHWSSHIAALTKDHSKIYSDAEEVVVDIKNDVDTLTEYKGSIHEVKEKLKGKEVELVAVLKDNKHLAEHFSKIKEESDKIVRKLKYCSGKKDVIGQLKRKLLKDLKSEHELLEQKFSRLQLEKDKLCEAFTESAEEVQRNADMTHVVLEKKLQALKESLEKTEAQLSAVLSASNTDQTVLSGITKKTEANIDSRNTAINTLQHKINLISTARRYLLLNVEAKKIEAKEWPLSHFPVRAVLMVKSLQQNLD